MKTLYVVLWLVVVAFSGNLFAADCPTDFKRFNRKTVGAAMTCLKQENASLRESLNALSGGGGDGSSTVIEQLQKDVGYLMGLPKVEPVGIDNNNPYIKTTVIGLSKFVDTGGSGISHLEATFQLQNISGQNLYIAATKLTFLDDHGITASGSMTDGIRIIDCCNIRLRGAYSIVPPNGIISIGGKSNNLTREQTSQLGSRFNISFPIFRYINPSFDSGDYEENNIGFSGISPRQ